MRTPSMWIQEASGMIASSPLAVANEKAIEPMVREAARLRAELLMPVRVAVLGEVKAGKSMLVNALIGGKVAPTDVLEATAVTQYLRHGTGLGAVIYRDGRRAQMTPDELFAILEEHKKNEEFARSVDRVELELPLEGLETIQILDTPGLASMTETLSRKTLDAIAQFDVVVWVFNAHHSGAKDVLAVFDQVAGTGRPIIAVVNRIDELADDDVAAVLAQYEDRLEPWNVTGVLAASAKRACDGSDGGVVALRKKLEAFASSPDETKLQSACGQMDIILHSAAELHLAREEAAQAALEKREILRQRIIRAGASVMDDVHYKAMCHIQDELFAADYARLHERASNFVDTDHGLEKDLADVFSRIESRLAAEVQPAVVAKISGFFQEAWRREGHAIDQEIQSAALLQGVGSTHEQAAQAHLGEFQRALGDLNMDSVWEPVVKETAVWTGAGTALAAYAAWFGANAAFISIGTALSALVPPLAIAGVTVGVVRTFFDQRAKVQKRTEAVEKAFRDLRNQIFEKLWVHELRPVTAKLNQDIIDKLTAEQSLFESPLCRLDPAAIRQWADKAETFRRLSPLKNNFAGSVQSN